MRTSKTMFPSVWHPNTQIQIHKYTNTVWVKFEDRPNMWYIFEKVMIRGPQKHCSQVSDIQIHKYKYTNIQIHKYTNTQIQFGSNYQIDLTCDIFFKMQWYEDLKNNVPRCLTSKYTNTDTQIHKYSLGQIWIFQLIASTLCQNRLCQLKMKIGYK